MSFCIAIPTVNRYDLLIDALNLYSLNMPNTDIFIVDNGNQNIKALTPRIKVFVQETNLGVSSSWNLLISLAKKNNHSHILMLNDDIILQRYEGEINQMIEQEDNLTFHRPRPFYNWSSFILSQEIVQKVGYFDEAFKKAFFEDNDYEYRMKLKGVKIKYQDNLNAQVYKNSQTIERDPLLGGYLENRELYLKKWGGLPNEEQFKTPYNA